ncbi:NUDIX domain-containing protein [Plastoroseomonas hellenica]|uniref:NUDIX domain-containing protein n=1 Tax=Plastoroseomonas hellenica TaxID=2687306 RepID=UPI001BA9B93E|nr:NUDIX hydrolase [Plastoroseomonas hellenica]
MAEILSTEVAYSRWSTMILATIRLPDGQVTKRDIEDHGEAAMVLPYDPERRVALVIRQFRTPVHFVTGEGMVLEATAGRLDGEEPEACARREAMEEAGVRLAILEPVACTWSMPALSTERISLFLAPYAAADRMAEGGGLVEEHEEISVAEMPLQQLAAMADAGTPMDLKLFALIQTLRIRRPQLFT